MDASYCKRSAFRSQLVMPKWRPCRLTRLSNLLAGRYLQAQRPVFRWVPTRLC
jgi:hypothetical protein